MKRVRVAPGKFVTISAELAEKAARVFASGLTREQIREFKASEPLRAKGVLAGSTKPLAIAKVWTGAKTKITASAPARKISTTVPSALRRKSVKAQGL